MNAGAHFPRRRVPNGRLARMTLALSGPDPRAAASPPGALVVSPALAFAIGALMFAAMQTGAAIEVWTQGGYIDTDDAMRMVRVREWMAGQAWFDFSVPRMSPPDGFRTHWSHVIDLPIAALIHLFGVALDPVHAERAARLAFPFLCFLATLGLLIAAARRLAGTSSALIVALLAPTAAFAFQFRAGRVDHHGPQLLLLAAMMAAMTTSLDPRRVRAAAAAGAAAALSLAVSVENLPFIAAVGAIYGLLATLDPRRARAGLWFGATFALATACAWAVFADAVAGPVCDALSTFHVGLAGLGGLGLAGLALAAPRLPAPARWAGLAALGLAALALAKIAFPQCLQDPLAAVPALAVEFWLSHVTEAEPLLTALRNQPAFAVAVAAPILLALPPILWAAYRGLSGEPEVDAATARWRWAALAGLVAVGAAATFWQVRAGGSTQVPALMGAAAASVAAAAFAQRRGLTPLWAILACMPFSALFWAAVTPDKAAAQADAPAAADCLTPKATAGLQALAPGLVLTSLDPGSYLLAQTDHRVLGGAYHRNARGNVDALEAMLGSPDRAREVVRARKVDYVAICAGLDDVRFYVGARPQSFAARLAAGAPPDWLAPVAVEGPWRVYRPR